MKERDWQDEKRVEELGQGKEVSLSRHSQSRGRPLRFVSSPAGDGDDDKKSSSGFYLPFPPPNPNCVELTEKGEGEI